MGLAAKPLTYWSCGGDVICRSQALDLTGVMQALADDLVNLAEAMEDGDLETAEALSAQVAQLGEAMERAARERAASGPVRRAA